MLINHGIRLTLPELPVMIDGKYRPRYEIKPVMPKVELMRKGGVVYNKCCGMRDCCCRMRKGGVVYGRMPLITKKKDLKC
jgi:hypothetical protein